MLRTVFRVICLLLLVAHSWAQPLEKIAVQLEWKYQFEFAGFIAAVEKGYYRQAGLDVTLIEYEPGSDPLERVINREVNYGVHNSSIVIRDGHIQPVVILATYLQRSPLVFVSRPGIDSPSDFVGQTVMGTSSELRDSSLSLLLEHFFITPANTRFVEHSFDIDDFAEGRVDVMTAFRSNQLFELERRGIKYSVIDPADYGFVTNAVNVVAASGEVLEHEQRTRRFIEATNLGWRYALDHTEEIIDLIYERYSQAKSREALAYEARVTREMMLLDFFQLGSVSQEMIDRSFQQLQRAGLVQENDPYQQLTLNSLLEASGQRGRLAKSQLDYLTRRRVITYCVSPHWLPFETISSGQHIGIVADMFSEGVIPYLPVPFELVETPTWSETLVAARHRRCDVIPSVARTPSRSEYLDYSEPYLSYPLVLVTDNQSLFLDNLRTVGKQPIGVMSGSAVIDILRASYGDELNIVEVAHPDEGLEMILGGQLFGYVDVLQVAANRIANAYATQLKVSARLPETFDIRIGIRNDEPELVAVFSQLGLNLARDEALRQKVVSRWVSPRESSAVDVEILLKGLGVALLIAVALLVHYLRLRKYNRLLKQQSISDPLTRLYNRIRSDEVLHECFERFKRYGEPTGLILMDIDHFKRVNDEYGHQVGDEVLVSFAHLVRENVRATDIACRWGGEEFMVICPHLDGEETLRVANKLGEVVRSHAFPTVGRLTVSIGVSAFNRGRTLEQVITAADNCLYAAKDGGRDRVVVDESSVRAGIH